MKKKELNNLRKMEKADLDKEISKRKAELVKVSREMIESKEKNVRLKKTLRHEIAQILTIKGIIQN